MATPTTDWTTPSLFSSKNELETPVLTVDLDTMEDNLREYANFAETHDVRLRSHVKTHKNAEIARLQSQISNGGGIVCQTISEAEVMAKNGLEDIYLSYTVVSERKLHRLVWLARKLERFATTVDSIDNIEPLQTVASEHDVPIDVVLEIDVGLNRTGVSPGEPALEVARFIQEQSHVELCGILAYEAHVKGDAATRDEYEQECMAAMDVAEGTVDLLEAEGIPVEEVKVGGTATSKYSGKHPVVTEINPGMYPFMDVGELKHRPFDIRKDDCAATVVSTVISKPTEDRAVVNAGSKTLSLDKPQMPVPKNRDDINYANASEEHGWIDTSDSEEPIEVGDRLEFIVPHVCTTINLHDTIVGVRDGTVEEIWPVQARGKVR
ncbi:D-serine deaminase, pyridoxal phosphate-dependent [Haladaptatus litoreus]|uniref:D-serine deaminase, pyridoxal phosphate-dependent n=1 Tax=Haladaptatus litoreus TaxID=553468 RepID=A0A1N7EM04_9EURY|nr:alanine racemase [Haladaptatus litoreus]SIR89110.1 D-serine deaminase, pyridoxal phosphate-dependent [Haladaptatus litoreus]